MHHSRLEQYLDRLEEPLAAFPSEVRAEWREEARQHLLHLIAAYEELGTPPDEAVQAAIRQFGDPEHIGKNLQTATWKVTRQLSGHDAFRLLTSMSVQAAALGALLCLPGALDHLSAIGVTLGAIYGATGVVRGRLLKSLMPRAAALKTLWSNCFTAVPYLGLLVFYYFERAEHAQKAIRPLLGGLLWPVVPELMGLVLGGSACLGGLLLGTWATYRARQRSNKLTEHQVCRT